MVNPFELIAKTTHKPTFKERVISFFVITVLLAFVAAALFGIYCFIKLF